MKPLSIVAFLLAILMAVVGTLHLETHVQSIIANDVVANNNPRFMNESYSVYGSYKLDWTVWPEPVICFNNSLDNGFKVKSSNLVLDLNGHSVIFSSGKAPGQDAVVIEDQHGVTIKNGDFSAFQIGIYIRDSTDINIINNTVSQMAIIGISIEKKFLRASNITISNNTLSGIEKQGIWLNTVDHTNVSDNDLSQCATGIMMYDSSNCTISNNIITTSCGIYMDISSGNIISNNTLSGDSVGLDLEHSNSNVICHNNFVNNPSQVQTSDSVNTWDYGYPYGGNYWSDCDGEDRFSGVKQNILGSDGIGDYAYVIDENNRDTYPLKNQWDTILRVFDVTWNISMKGETWKMLWPVAIFSNSSVSDFNCSIKTGVISFNVKNGTFCRVIIAKKILEGAFNCSVDASPESSSLNWDNTHVFMDFAYSNNNHKVTITGEKVTPTPSDLNNDGTVNIVDIALVAKDFGRTTGP
jgi:parallel beta-helix repeat protein